MKKVLDKLMARQMRLMDALSEPPPDKVSAGVRTAHASGPAPTQAEIEAESAAVDGAMEYLAAGDMAAAAALLDPYDSAAALTRTLTTLARMKTRQGEHEQALAYLQRTERLDPMDRKVWYFLAELFHLQQRHAEEADYRRRLAYAGKDAAAKSYIDLIAAIVKAAPKSGHPRLSEIKLLAAKLDDTADIDDAQRVALAKALYPVGPLAELAKSHYATASPCPPGHRDSTVRMVSLIAWCKQASAPMSHIPDAGVRGRRPVVAELRDVWVLPNLQWMPVVDGGKALLANFASDHLRLQADDPASPLLLQCKHRADLRLPRGVPLLETTALLVGGSGEYSADLLEYLGVLAVADSLGIGKDLPIVVSDALAPRQLELLALLGYDAARLIRFAPTGPCASNTSSCPRAWPLATARSTRCCRAGTGRAWRRMPPQRRPENSTCAWAPRGMPGPRRTAARPKSPARWRRWAMKRFIPRRWACASVSTCSPMPATSLRLAAPR